MGEGQIPRATKAIADGMQQGNWVVIENCHVDEEWLDNLEIICLNLTACDEVNEDFRLWLTSSPSEEFPMIILQTSSKISTERPGGVANNASLLLAEQPWAKTDMCTNDFEGEKLAIWQRCVLSLSLFHTIVRQRVATSPLGWNIPYEIYEADLVVSLVQLNASLVGAESFSFFGHSLLIRDFNYGGRIFDERDRILLEVLLSEIFNEAAIYEDGFKYTEFGNFCLPSVPTDISSGDIFAGLRRIEDVTLLGLTEISIFDQNCDESLEVCHLLKKCAIYLKIIPILFCR